MRFHLRNPQQENVKCKIHVRNKDCVCITQKHLLQFHLKIYDGLCYGKGKKNIFSQKNFSNSFEYFSSNLPLKFLSFTLTLNLHIII